MTIAAQFAIPFIRVLDDNGVPETALPNFATDKDHLLTLYRNMVMLRLFDKKAITLQRTGKMGTYASVHGQEAISVAIGVAMKPDDVFVPYYRDYATQFARGVKMAEILAYWGGDERGSNFSGNAEDLPISVPIATQCLHAAGVAFAFKYRNEARVAVTCIGDGGTSEGDFYEAMNVAGVWKLPVVFVINNNQWAISVPLVKQTATQTLAQKAIAAGFDGIQVDGNDIIALSEVITNAIDKARNGGGPTLIEAMTWRLCDHTTADDATRYQPCDAVDEARKHEPLARLRKFLAHEFDWSESNEEELTATCNSAIQTAVDEYMARPPQDITSAFDHMYANLPDYLIEQRAIALEEVANA